MVGDNRPPPNNRGPRHLTSLHSNENMDSCLCCHLCNHIHVKLALFWQRVDPLAINKERNDPILLNHLSFGHLHPGVVGHENGLEFRYIHLPVGPVMNKNSTHVSNVWALVLAQFIKKPLLFIDMEPIVLIHSTKKMIS